MWVSVRMGWIARVRMLLVGGILGCALASGAVALPFGGSSASQVALACGLGNTPTMMANNTPALFYPIPVNKNVPANQPAGVFAPDYAMNTPITFSDDLSAVPNAPDPSTLKWRWNFGDGPGWVSQQTPTHTYKKAGKYDVDAEIYVDGAWVDNPPFDSAEIHVVSSLPPNPPVARVTESSPVAFFGQSVTFDASGSTSSDGSPLTYFWNFNDGTTATGVRVSHQFVLTGKGFVSLTVTDSRGAKGIATINIIAPKNHLDATASTIAPNRSITFTVPSSDVISVPGQAVSYLWGFGDGSQNVTTSQPTVSHTFSRVGQYIITMQETYGQGGGATANQQPFDGLVVTVAIPPTPTPLWRYYVGGAAVALGILISLAAAARAQRRQLALATQERAAHDVARARRVGRAPHVPAGRSGSRRDPRGYGPRGEWDEAYPPPGPRRPPPGGSSGRWNDERRGPPRQGPPRQGPSPRRPRLRDDDRW